MRAELTFMTNSNRPRRVPTMAAGRRDQNGSMRIIVIDRLRAAFRWRQTRLRVHFAAYEIELEIMQPVLASSTVRNPRHRAVLANGFECG